MVFASNAAKVEKLRPMQTSPCLISFRFALSFVGFALTILFYWCLIWFGNSYFLYILNFHLTVILTFLLQCVLFTQFQDLTMSTQNPLGSQQTFITWRCTAKEREFPPWNIGTFTWRFHFFASLQFFKASIKELWKVNEKFILDRVVYLNHMGWLVLF